MNEKMINVNKLCIDLKTELGPKRILDQFSFSIGPNQIIGLLGPSGSGKSMTALALMGLLSKRVRAEINGQILFNQENILQWNEAKLRSLRGQSFAMVFQNPFTYFNPSWRIKRHFKESLQNHNDIEKIKKSLVQVALNDTERMLNSYPHQLSGGQLQRLMFALAIMNQPKLLITDEPTTALDATLRSEILKLMRSLRDDLDLSILFISHDTDSIKNTCDTVYKIDQGKLISKGRAKDLDQQTYEIPPITEVKPGTSTLIRTHQISKQYKTTQALQRTDLEIKEGECLAIVGESGSGKSTLGKILSDIIKPSTGSVQFSKKEINTMTPKERARHVQMIFQDPYSFLDSKMTVEALLREPLKIHHLDYNNDLIHHTLHEVGLNSEHLRRYPHQLSGGQLQRVSIARALILKPKVLIADEPTSAVDLSMRNQIIDLLKKSMIEHKMSLVLITHDLSIVKQIAHRIAIFYHGKLLEIGSLHSIFYSSIHPYTQRLLDSLTLTSSPPLMTMNHWLKVTENWNHFKGCPFQEVCPSVIEKCYSNSPLDKNDHSMDHWVWCHHSPNTD